MLYWTKEKERKITMRSHGLRKSSRSPPTLPIVGQSTTATASSKSTSNWPPKQKTYKYKLVLYLAVIVIVAAARVVGSGHVLAMEIRSYLLNDVFYRGPNGAEQIAADGGGCPASHDPDAWANARFKFYLGDWAECGLPGGHCPSTASGRRPQQNHEAPCADAGGSGGAHWPPMDAVFCFHRRDVDRGSCRWMNAGSPAPLVYSCEFARWPQDTVPVMFGDSHDVSAAIFNSTAVLTKVRPAGQTRAVLFKLNQLRHWSSVDGILAQDTMPFAAKKNAAVWRGTTTSDPVEYLDSHNGWRGQRPHLVRRIPSLAGDDRFDVRVSKYLDGVPRTAGETNAMDPRDMVQYKMIIAPEGNDVATGLKWALGSTSAVVMPEPTVSSWAAEELLEPWVHYIPVRRDFADLGTAVNWCLDRPDECEAVGRRGRCFMLPFLNRTAEEAMQRRVMAAVEAAEYQTRSCELCG